MRSNTKNTGLTIERIRKVFNYEPETGIMRWAIRTGSRSTIGAIAGHLHNDNYWRVRVDRKLYLTHRLIWLYVYGEWPDRDIDHINMDRADNRLSNLRLATCGQNNVNSGTRNDNTSGYKGVIWHKRAKKWWARIHINGKQIDLGYFDDPKDGYAAYCKAAALYYGEFARVA